MVFPSYLAPIITHNLSTDKSSTSIVTFIPLSPSAMITQAQIKSNQIKFYFPYKLYKYNIEKREKKCVKHTIYINIYLHKIYEYMDTYMSIWEGYR